MKTATARDDWNARYSTSDYDRTVKPNQFVEAHASRLDPGDAIDLGAGKGRNAVWLASQGWNVTAVDFSPIGLELAARLAADRDVPVAVVEADATTYQPDGPVDLVVVSYLQLEPHDRRTVLERAKNWLNPGGTIIVVAHDRSNLSGGYGGPSAPEVCYTVEEAVDALEGLDITEATVAERVVSTDTGTDTALDTLVIGTKPIP